ncbi:hypothetical protein [Arthrobacter cupressi]|uniref:DUF4352 domain-containing protein n=1 Tax=Arthrobacter cupressi TaxID=1045773 RepID=A0A1G8IXU2_9MICC|nr:hypothetical protein [Arthrobacter cupressi]NYD79160.1 hypothetical protein [Arthrobacter cupressi]SDI23653.1 hypothetical protein SAMN05216555_101389 [Arthrobacter cupressi]
MKNSSRSGPAPGSGAARRAGPRLRAALLVAALALPGAGLVVWAATQSGMPGGTPQGSQGAPSAATVPGGTGSTTPGGTATTAAPPSGTESPAPAPTAKATTPEKDPAPVDRKGKTEQELATIAQPVAPAVPLTAKKTVKSGITATITELQAVDGEARGIGEIAGPAIRFKVTVVNGTTAAVKLGTALVTVTYGNDETPASSLSGPGATEFPLTVAAGASASSTLVFGVPKDQRADVRIYFSLDALTPIAAFEGQAPQ